MNLKKNKLFLGVITVLVLFVLFIFTSIYFLFRPHQPNNLINLDEVELERVTAENFSISVPSDYVTTSREGAVWGFKSKVIKGSGTNGDFEIAAYERTINENFNLEKNTLEDCKAFSQQISSIRHWNLQNFQLVSTTSNKVGCLAFYHYLNIGRGYITYFPHENGGIELGHIFSTIDTNGTEEQHKNLFTTIVETFDM